MALSDKAIEEVEVMYEKVLDAYTLSLKAMKENNVNIAKEVLEIEEAVDNIE